MSTALAVDYLRKLLNRPIDSGTLLRLSSAQRARFNAWLHSQGITGLDASLTGEFSLDELFARAPRASGPGNAPLAQAAAAPTDTNQVSALVVGVDIQKIDELLANVNVMDLKADPDMIALFTARELSYAQARPTPLDTLGGIYAAKEAIRKCNGARQLTADAFRSLEILPDDNGKPCAAGFEVSISHSGGFAVAVACRLDGVPTPVPTSTLPEGARKPELAGASSGARTVEVGLIILIAVSVCVQLALLVRLLPWRW